MEIQATKVTSKFLFGDVNLYHNIRQEYLNTVLEIKTTKQLMRDKSCRHMIDYSQLQSRLHSLRTESKALHSAILYMLGKEFDVGHYSFKQDLYPFPKTYDVVRNIRNSFFDLNIKNSFFDLYVKENALSKEQVSEWVLNGILRYVINSPK